MCTKDGLQTTHFTDHVQICFLFLICRKTSLQMMKAIANATDRKQTSYREGISPFSSISLSSSEENDNSKWNTDEEHSDREVTKRVRTMRAVMDSTGIVHKVRQRLEDIKLQHQKSEMNDETIRDRDQNKKMRIQNNRELQMWGSPSYQYWAKNNIRHL